MVGMVGMVDPFVGYRWWCGVGAVSLEGQCRLHLLMQLAKANDPTRAVAPNAPSQRVAALG